MSNNYPAERALLGGLMLDARDFDAVAEIITPRDFDVDGHGEIYGAMLWLHREGHAPEPEAVILHQSDRCDRQQVIDIFSGAVSAANVLHYASLIRSAADQRKLRDFGRRLAENEQADYSAALAELETLNRETIRSNAPPARGEMVPTKEEMDNATLAPRCIVDRYLFADVATMIAPGGVGKTTLLLFEAACIALGRPLHGLKVINPGWTLIVSAEDARPRLLARLGQIIAALELTQEETALVLARVLIWDVAGKNLRLIHLDGGNIGVTALADDIVRRYRDDPPAVVVFDPLISFGVQESLFNDNEQGIITACRRIVSGLECCVRLVHHTGKGQRTTNEEQYSGRGGSALADGARMVAVLKTWNEELGVPLPPLLQADNRASIAILSRPKLSYSPPNLPRIFVKRTGFGFESFVEPPPLTQEQIQDALADQIERFLSSELSQERRWTKNRLETQAKNLGMTVKDLRRSVDLLLASGRLINAQLPQELRQGSKQTFLCPANSDERLSE
jgi:RecA-family ATPase